MSDSQANLTFDAAIATVAGAIRWNSGQNGRSEERRVGKEYAAALHWLAAVCRERRLKLTVEVVDE